MRPEGREHGLKLARNFGEEYTIESIRRRILTQTPKTFPIVPSVYTEKRVYVLKGSFDRTKKIGGLRGLYFHYCYLLGILPKNRPPIDQTQLHFLLREELRKLDTISKETRLLCHYHIDTVEQLFSLKGELQGEMNGLCEERKHLRYKSRSIREEEKLTQIKAEISGLTEQIGKLRKEVMLCDGIAARSGIMKEKLKIVRQEKIQKKEEVNHEHIRRSR